MCAYHAPATLDPSLNFSVTLRNPSEQFETKPALSITYIPWLEFYRTMGRNSISVFHYPPFVIGGKAMTSDEVEVTACQCGWICRTIMWSVLV